MKRPDIKLPTIKSIKGYILDFRRDVIRMMRLKFICVAMGILIAVFITMLTAINMIMNTVSQSQSARLLQQIAESDRYNTIEYGGMWGGDNPPEPPNGSDPPLEEMLPEASVPPSDNASAERPHGGFLSLGYDDTYFRPGGGWDRRNMPTDDGGEIDWDEYFKPPGWNWEDDPKNNERDDENSDNEPDDDMDEPPTEWQRPSEEVPPWVSEAPVTEATPPPTDAAVPAEVPPAADPEPPATDAPPPPQPTEPVSTESETPTDPLTEATTGDVSESVTETTSETETETETMPPETPPPTNDTGQHEPREPRMDRWKVPITIDHFAILVDHDGGFIGIRNTENYTEDEATEIMEGILAKDRTAGMYGWLQFCTAEKEYGTLLVITDKTSDQGLLNNLFRTTVIIGIIMLLVLLAILIFLSQWITKPVQQAFKRQKQFVSDAGHELKTPIAVLTTNADILQDEIGENKWLVYMQEQIARMNQLVGDLLRLARMDNATQEYTFKDFDLSLAVAATTLPFESSAFEQHKTLEMDVQPDVRYCGSEQHIRQLCAIFIDNALKYSNDNGIIKVTLMQRGDHQILEFYNTGCEISQAETTKIFERFYRGDKARNSTKKSGYGLGLAIAKSIMEVHKIKFQVTCEQGKWIRFLLTF